MHTTRDSAPTPDASQRLLRQQAALAELTSGLLRLEQPLEAVRHLLGVAGRALDVGRVSLWRFTDEHAVAVSVEVLGRGLTNALDEVHLATASYPCYFAALLSAEALAIDDVASDARASDLREEYFRPLGIAATMDVPIQVGGRLTGIVCYESLGVTRSWSPGDQLFGIAIAHLLSLVAEQEGRIEVESALRESEERFRQLAENVNEVLWLTTPDKQSMLYVSPAYETTWGRTRQELYGSPASWMEAIHPEDRDRVGEGAQSRQVAGTYDETYRIVRPDGSTRWIRDRAFPIRDEGGEVYRLAGVAEDVTELKLAVRAVRELSDELEARVAERTAELEQANRALRESESRLRQVIDLVPHFIFAKDQSGRFLLVNRAVAELNGTTVEAMLAGTLESLAHSSDDARRYRAEDEEVIRGGRAKVIPEEVMTDAEGRERIVSTVKIPFAFSDSEAAAVLGVSTDITERKRAEAERDHLEQQLRRAQKMEAIGTLAGGISHDFNNILTSILGFADLLGKRLHGDAEAMRDVEQITLAGKRASDLVRQILTFSRQQRQSRSLIPLQSTIEEALGLLRAAIPATVEFTVGIDDCAPPVLADATQIHQVMMNLGANAAAAMETNLAPRLEVEYGRFDVDRAFAQAHPGLLPGPHVRLLVRDNGHGMDAATLDRVFEPFFTTKDPSRGTGLGLAVVHGIVRDHDGAITVESARDAGTTFRLYFPAREQPVAATAPERAGLRRGRGERVLCIDDEAANAQLLERILVTLGYAADAYTSPAGALAAFRARPYDFDLVITDLTMPVVSGVELAIEVLAIRPDTPVLLITGFSGSISEEHAREAGLRGLLFKPFSLESLGQAVARCLDQPSGVAKSAPAV